MKVCFLIDDFSATGGIQRVLPIVANALSASIEVHTVSMYDINNDHNRTLYNDQITFKVLMQGPKLYLKQCFKIAKLLKDYIKQNAIDILIATSEMLSPYCYLATLFTKTKFCVWTHCPANLYSEALVQRPFKYLGLKTADCTIALTPETETDLKKLYHTSKVTTIPNPIDPGLLKPVNYDSGSKRIMAVGRLSKQKNFAKLVEVAALVTAEHPDWYFDLYGDGELRTELTKLIAAEQLQDHLILKGNVSNVYDLYSRYAFLVMTSLYEGFPMVLLEALANGLPLVAFDIKTGPNLLINDKENGYLIKPFDSAAMAEKICELIKNTELREKMSMSSVERIGEFNIDSIVQKWLALFEDLLRKPHR